MHDYAIRDWRLLQRSLIFLLSLFFCLYFSTLFQGLFADDDIYLAYANRFLRDSHWTELYQLLLRPANPWEFLPLRDFTYWLDFRLYGDEPTGFHATNLLWYAASGLASFWLFRELILLCRPAWAMRASVLSLCGMLLFIAHPAHVEVAAWVASRKDLIAGTFVFLSLATLARATRRGWLGHEMVLAALLLFAACFGKASAMAGILCVTVLFGVGWCASPGVSRAKKLSYLFLFWILVAIAFLVHLKVGEVAGIRIENHPGFFAMFERASRIFTAQIGILLFPYPLRFYHDVYQLGDWHWLVTAGATLLLIASLVVLSLRRSLWAFGVVLAFSPLCVYLQLMPFTTWSLASERFVFVSVAGLALVLIDFFGRLDSPKIIGGMLLIVAVLCALVVWVRIGEWEYGATLRSREYQLNPSFHNAIRDRIVFTLVPEKRYGEASSLARQLSRPYAAEALLALIAAEQAFQRLSFGSSFAVAAEGLKSRENFCSALAKLQSATHHGYAQIPYETDISYNNILRSLDQVLKNHFGDVKKMCGGDGAKALR
jgi:hypothetical protein